LGVLVLALVVAALGGQRALGAEPLAVSASATAGAAPLAVTFTASPGADSYTWAFGDGSAGMGRIAEHVYAEPGAYTAVVTARWHDGSVSQAETVVTAYRISLAIPATATYRQRVVLRASVVPALVGAPLALVRGGEVVARAATGRGGTATFALRASSPGPYGVRFGEIASAERTIAVRPVIAAHLVGSGAVGEALRLVASLQPAAAGQLRVRIRRNGRLTYDQTGPPSVRLGLRTRRPASYRIELTSVAASGWAAANRSIAASVIRPRLSIGSRGPAVRSLERRLMDLRYVLPRVDASYRLDTYEAVIAFQRVNGLPTTGRVDPRTWGALSRARTPMPRYRGTHIEVSKRRQYLLVVKRSRVTTIVHVSTGATGNTPLGRWRVYRKVVGWDWVLWYPMYFLRGFAIHGYPSVPAYPASHGCVRVPMWVAPRLYAQHPYGTTIYVY
jgi:hypothetical protein